MDAEKWAALLQTLGVATVCLVALAVAVWKSLRWIGLHVAGPVAARHIKFLDEIATAMKESIRAQRRTVREMRRVYRRVEHLAGLVERHGITMRTDSVTINPKGADHGPAAGAGG